MDAGIKKQPSVRFKEGTGAAGHTVTPQLSPEGPDPQEPHSKGWGKKGSSASTNSTGERRRSLQMSNGLERLRLDGGGRSEDPYRFTLYDYLRLKVDMLTNNQFDERTKEVAESIRKVLHSVIYDLCMLLITLFILSADAIRYLAVDKDSDWKIMAVASFVLVLCSLDIFLRYLVEDQYGNSFLFWMDVISLLAVIWDILTHVLSDQVWYLNTTSTFISVGESIRVVCLLRIARMARVVTLIDQFTASFQRMLNRRRITTVLPVNTRQDEGEAEKPQQKTEQLNTERSRVSNEFIEMTVRKVIVVIVVICLVFPLLEPSRMVYSNRLPKSHREGLAQLDHMSGLMYPQATDIQLEVLKRSVQDYAQLAGAALLWLKLDHVPQNVTDAWLQQANVTTLLPMATITSTFRGIESPGIKYGDTTAFFDGRHRVDEIATMNLLLRLFALVLIIVCGVIFRYAQSAVTVPIERMTIMVQNLAENPLAKLEGRRSSVDKTHIVMSPIRAIMRKPSERVPGGPQGNIADKEETALLENVLMKISQLLQIGFGTAGAELIAKNMRGGAENALGNGKKVTCVFGFCKIDDFTSICSGLEEDVCTYINTIAYIVHQGVVQWNGAPNKNTGSAFFCVWKLQEAGRPNLPADGEGPQNISQVVKMLRDKNAKEAVEREGSAKKRKFNLKNQILSAANRAQQLTPTVDNAVLSLIAIRCELQYAVENTAFQRFRNQFGESIEVKLGFGLHVGWAIEGALGSLNKIDATYLSPNVNLASRLEAATHQFGCPMLMSGELVQYLSPRYKEMCRMIDCVKAKGSDQPMELWTFDITDYPSVCGHISPPDRDPGGNIIPKLRFLQRSINTEFRHFFAIGIDSYITGEWKKAKDFLLKALEAKPDDGPSRCILRVLEGSNCQAPPGWSGCRALTEK